MAEPALKPMSVTEFLTWERGQELRHEYDHGAVTAMTGGTLDHNDIAFNLRRELGERLRDAGCRAYSENAKVRGDAAVFYPDVVVTCRPVDGRADEVADPVLIAEVMSDTTEAADRGRKWLQYKKLGSLQYYLLISQQEPRVEVFTRQGDLWMVSEASGLDGFVALPFLNLTLALRIVYERTSLALD